MLYSADYKQKILHKQIKACQKCGLCKEMPAPSKPVPGVGPACCAIMIVGEALELDDAILEMPFVGMHGKYLDRLIDKAGLRRDHIYITNTVKCRPSKSNGKYNRPPEDNEVKACKLWLWEEIQLIKPKAIITLGKLPTRILLSQKKSFSLEPMIGYGYKPLWTEATVFPCYHPSYLMVRNSKEQEAIDIFSKVKGFINNVNS